MPTKPQRFLWISLVVAWIFDLLFWKQAPGISFFAYAALLVVATHLVMGLEGEKASLTSLSLLVPLAFFAVMSFIRREPMSQFINFSLSLALLVLYALTFQGGRWMAYALLDYVTNFFSLVGNAFVGGGKIIGQIGGQKRNPDQPRPPSHAGAIIRGLLLALPVVIILASLLASADPIFSKNLKGLLDLLRIENIGEYIFRFFYILVLAYVFTGVFLHIFTKSADEKLSDVDKPTIRPFLGWIEAIIVLASVDLLFAFFVSIQFQYFFGGNTNIHIDGYTYSEYARRGFGELVMVAFLSLILFLGLTAITRRETTNQRRTFTGLGIGLVVLVCVILVSAFQRLLLYEQVYGFSRLRTYPHVFMVWLGILLVALLFLEIFQRPRAFGLTLFLCIIGFGVTINVLNVDAFIVRQNVDRAALGWELDAPYLTELSNDAVPELFAIYDSDRYSPQIKEQIGGSLACRFAYKPISAPAAWTSFHLSDQNALLLYEQHQDALAGYKTFSSRGDAYVTTLGGKEIPCWSYRGID